MLFSDWPPRQHRPTRVAISRHLPQYTSLPVASRTYRTWIGSDFKRFYWSVQRKAPPPLRFPSSQGNRPIEGSPIESLEFDLGFHFSNFFQFLLQFRSESEFRTTTMKLYQRMCLKNIFIFGTMADVHAAGEDALAVDAASGATDGLLQMPQRQETARLHPQRSALRIGSGDRREAQRRPPFRRRRRRRRPGHRRDRHVRQRLRLRRRRVPVLISILVADVLVFLLLGWFSSISTVSVRCPRPWCLAFVFWLLNKTSKLAFRPSIQLNAAKLYHISNSESYKFNIFSEDKKK